MSLEISLTNEKCLLQGALICLTRYGKYVVGSVSKLIWDMNIPSTQYNGPHIGCLI